MKKLANIPNINKHIFDKFKSFVNYDLNSDKYNCYYFIIIYFIRPSNQIHDKKNRVQ